MRCNTDSGMIPRSLKKLLPLAFAVSSLFVETGSGDEKEMNLGVCRRCQIDRDKSLRGLESKLRMAKYLAIYCS